MSKLSDIDALTLQYFTNSSQYNKIANPEANKLSEADKKFYRKRIIQLTKDTFKTDPPSGEIKRAFDNYLIACVDYFKVVDASDIMQEEYDGFVTTDANLDNVLGLVKDEENPDKLLFKEQVTPTQTLDSFVNLKKVSLDSKQLPQKKIINIKDKNLKTKGVKKKNDKVKENV
jgi:hypothetical protein|tara:strand:- start:95 stop:613 length:519 start_codon:yes stop_codon:yes gene_type:complete